MMGTELQKKQPHSVNELCLRSNHDQFGIIKLDTVSIKSICFICKTVINFSELDPCNKTHLSSNEHKANQIELFKQCFYTPGLNSTNTIQNYISNNSFIDFSSATEISTGNVNVNCFVCKIDIPSLGSSEDVWISDVLQHLKDEHHMRNIQDNFSWTCNLPATGHVMFYKTLFYCSVCEESISCDDRDLIPTAVDHLETNHLEGFISHGFEIETMRLVKKTNHSVASDSSFDFDVLEEISDDLYSTCEDESAFVDDDTCLTADAYEVSLPKVKNEETENNKHDVLSCVRIESGEDMEKVGDGLEVKVQMNYVSDERENCNALVIPAQKHDAENSFPSVEKKVETLDNNGSTKENGVCKQFVVDNYPKQVLVEELSICNLDTIPKGKHQDHKQTNVEQSCLTKTKNYTDKKKLFSNLYDCLPASFHKDLSFVTIKSNQFYCELCNCSIGVVLNVFESSFILHSHFSLMNHKSQMDVLSKSTSENKNLKVKQSLSNTKREEKTSIVSSNTTEEKFMDTKNINQRNHVPLISASTANSQTNMVSNTSEKIYISDLQGVSSNTTLVKKQTDLETISSIATSKVQKQNETQAQDVSSNSPTVPKQTEVKVVPNSPLKLTQVNKDNKLFDIQDISGKIQNEIHDASCNILTAPNQTEVKFVHNNPLMPTKVDNEIEKTNLGTVLPSPIMDLLSDSILRVHHGFFKHTHDDSIYCCLCSCDVGKNRVDLKSHITGITHKVQFLSQLKKSLKESKRYQVKFLLFMNGCLYCSLCKCFVSPWDSFVGICKGVEAHFEMDAHITNGGENKIKSGEACQEIISSNEKKSNNRS